MLLVLDLGFSSLVVLVVCAVFPLIGLVLRSKWRRIAARKEEIRRLMILVSEETERAELEASAGHDNSYGYTWDDGYSRSDGYAYTDGYGDGYGTVSPAQSNRCAACHSPTTTRCANCKAVWYCSGKCQIVHWRQGHKDDCHPPAMKSDFDHKPSKHKQHASSGISVEDENSLESKSAPSFHRESKIVDSTEALKVKPGNVEVCNAESSSESSGTGFTGFSSSSVCNGSSDDVSICDSISSNDSGDLDENIPDNVAYDMSKTSSSAEDADKAKTISPKFASLVNSSGSSGLSESSQLDPASCAGQAQCKVASPSSLGNGSTQHDSVVEPSTSSATFWEGALDPAEPTDHPHHVSGSLNLNGNRVNNLSRVSVREWALLDEPVPNEKDNIESTLERVNSCNVSSFRSLKNERTRKMRSDSTDGSNLLRSAEAGPSISLRANIPLDSQKESLRSESLCNSSAGACRSSGRHLDSILRSIKVDEVDAVAGAVYTEVAHLSRNTGSDLKTSVGSIVDQLKGSTLSMQFSLRGSSDMAGRYSGKGLFPYELFVKLYTWKEVELRPCGLINCGNSCFANAVLQCLAFTPPLTAYFLQGLHSKMCARKEWCFMCEFECLILKAKEGDSPVSPFGIVSRMQDIGSQLSNGREEDAHEFLRCAIGVMESICLLESRISSGSPEEDTTLIGLTFGGYLRSKIRCTKCQGKSERQEKMMDLTVEIEGDIRTLEEALSRFTVSETLDGENKYRCDRCGSYEKARKKLTILEAPNVLTIALKRFQSGKYGKLNKSVSYPEILDLAPYMSGTSDKSPIYRLFGVIVHLDVMNASYSGHYICYVKNPLNKWFKIDDSMVTPVDLETVLKVGAYMLLYSRCSPRAPRSIRNQLISCDSKPKPVPPRLISKIPTFNPKLANNSSHDDLHPNLVSSDGLASIESFYSKFRQLRRILDEDSPSDSSSLFSSNSDEGSSSSDGTRDSVCTADDFSENLLGGWSSPWRNPSDTESSSSSLPSSSSSSPMARSERGGPGSSEASRPQVKSVADNSFLHSDASKARSDSLGSSRNSSVNSSNCRETNSERLVGVANGCDGVKSGGRSATAKTTESVPL